MVSILEDWKNFSSFPGSWKNTAFKGGVNDRGDTGNNGQLSFSTRGGTLSIPGALLLGIELTIPLT